MFGFIIQNKKSRRVIVSSLLATAILVSPCFTANLSLNATSSAENGLISFEDNFNYSNGRIDNKGGWVSKYVGTTPASSHQVKSKVLVAEDFSDCNGACTCTTERPMSEATVNQRASAKILNLNDLVNHSSANLHLRVVHGNHAKESDVSYFARVTSESIKIMKTGADWTVSDISSGGNETAFSIKKNHIYQVEFSAYGLCPTTLTATLYDISDGNKAVATVSGTDDTAELQRMGTTALSFTRNNSGQKSCMFDNFKYEQIDSLVYNDNFNRNDGSISNGWKTGSMAVATISDKTLNLKMSHVESPYEPHIEETALVRPMSEKSLDQLIQVEFKRPANWADIGGVIIARAQSETVTSDNCYRFVTHFAFDGAGNWTEYIYLQNSQGEELFRDLLRIDPDTKCLMQLCVNSISETETLLVATLYDVDNDYAPIYQNKVIDNDSNLQQAGSAGISLLDRWNGTLTMDNFSYVTPPRVEAAQIYPVDDPLPVKYEDNFDEQTGNAHGSNGWIDQRYLTDKDNFAQTKDGVLILDNGEMTDTGAYNYKLLRPMSEATLNQRVSVDLMNLDEIESAEVDLRIIEIPSDFNKVAMQSFYGIIIEKGTMVFCTRISWGQGEISGLEYEYKEGHIYRLVVTAQGSIPTVMVATLYDVTDGGAEVATLTARDMTLQTSDHRSAQLPGTVALSYRGENPAKFDNFVYEQMDAKVFHDSFNRKNGAPENGWVLGDNAVNSTVNSVKLLMDNSGIDDIWGASMMRPMSEKAIEQQVVTQFNYVASNSSLIQPVIFARANTDTKVTVDGAQGFSCYYTQLKYTGDWSATLYLYKVSQDGTKTLLAEKSTDIYGRLSNATARIYLMAQGTNPTKLNASLVVVEESKIYDIVNITLTDDQPELQQEGTAGMSFAGTGGKFTVEKFSYFKSVEIPAENPVPKDMNERYMAYFTGTVASGNFGQWVELDPGKEYVYSVRLKKLLDSGGFGIRVQYNPINVGRIYKEFAYDSIEIDETACRYICEFHVPDNAHILPNGKARIQIVVHEGGLSSTGYATDFHVYEKTDPTKKNLLVNPDFKKGFYAWEGHGYYIQGADVGGVMKTLGSEEVWLVPYDELAFVRDDSDIYFDDGDWASIYYDENGEYIVEDSKAASIKGQIRNSTKNPLAGVTVRLNDAAFETKTDKNGYFEFADLPEDYYFLSILMKDGSECEFNEMLIVDAGTQLELALTYDGDDTLIDCTALPGTGNRASVNFSLFVFLFSLSVLSVVSLKRRKKTNNHI